MTKIQDFLTACVACLLAFVLVLLFIVCLFTPHKTKDGQFTDPLKYWTSEEYYQNNF
jgi:hypothetical protein